MSDKRLHPEGKRPFDLRDSEVSQYAQSAKPGAKARIISVSTLYVTVELLEPTNLQPGQTVNISAE